MYNNSGCSSPFKRTEFFKIVTLKKTVVTLNRQTYKFTYDYRTNN